SRRDNAGFVDAACHSEQAGRAEVCPGEFFLARPDQLDGLARGFGQTRGLDCGFAAMFAAVARSRVGHDDAHAGLGDAERLGEFASYAEWSLRARPDGQLAVSPFGHGGAWF